MTIPVSPPPEPPALIRVERSEPDAGAQPGDGADVLLAGVQAAGAIGELAVEEARFAIEPERAELRQFEAAPEAVEMAEVTGAAIAPDLNTAQQTAQQVADDADSDGDAADTEPILIIPDADDADSIREELGEDRDTLIIEPLENPETIDASPDDTGEPPQSDGETIDLQTPLRLSSPLEVSADSQTFDRDRQIFTAIGNAAMRYEGGLLEADRIQVNLLTRMARGEGNVALTRTDGSILRGDKVRYNFAQEIGTIERATGEISTAPTVPTEDIPRTVAVPSTTLLPVPIGSRELADEPQSDRFLQDRPTGVFTTGGFNFSLGTGREFRAAQQIGAAGTLSRFRFDADTIDFYPNGWTGTDVRVTTDPFSPPESELRADRMVFTPLDPLRDELLMTRPRIVFDDSFTLPVLRRRYILDRGDREPPLVEFGFDQRDRDGFFIQRTFVIIDNAGVKFEIAPQFYAQRTFFVDGESDGASSSNSFLRNFGFTTELAARLNDRTSLAVETSLTDLNFEELELDESLRASARLTHLLWGNHRLTGEYTFRNRLFNGSLGFRTVHSSLGLVLSSPPIQLGNTGIVMNYQIGANRINADTDEAELLKPVRETNRVTLTRVQGSVSLDRGWNLWVGETLPPTAEEGLRYSPFPVLPYVRFFTGLRGISGFYSNGASEHSLRGTVGIQGQFGHFPKPVFDYTSVFVKYSESLIAGESPFQFDRVADRRTLSLGILQQIFGPFRFGIQTSINLDDNEAISTDYILEYSRRTYGIILSINPQREAGSLQLRINDFDWNGNAGAFTNRETCQGVRDILCRNN